MCRLLFNKYMYMTGWKIVSVFQECENHVYWTFFGVFKKSIDSVKLKKC